MPTALCHVIALTQLANGMFPISHSFHSNLKNMLLYSMLPLTGAFYWRLQCLPTKDKKQNKLMPSDFSAVFFPNLSSTEGAY